jgi:hypothetical protein
MLGYERFTLTAEQHRKIFPMREKRWCYSYHYYMSDDAMLLIQLINLPCKIVMLLAFPFLLLWNGLLNIREMWKDLCDMFFQYQRKSYISDYIGRGSDTFAKLEAVLKRGKIVHKK